MSQADVETWRQPIREIARRVAKKVWDRSIEASDLEQIGLLVILQTDDVAAVPVPLMRHILRCKMWDAVPRRASKYITIGGGDEVAEETPCWTPDMADVIDARRIMASMSGSSAAVVSLVADGLTITEAGRELGISKQAARAALLRTGRAYEAGRPIGVRGRPRRAA